jgi:short-subunit dehydrogenase
MQPESKVVLITGGNGGIGRPLVEKLLQADAEVTVVGQSQQPATNAWHYLQADLSQPHDVHNLCNTARDLAPDILINLAGQNAFCRFRQQSVDDMQAMLQTNLLTPMALCHAVLPGMLSKRAGHIVNVGSVLGSLAAPLLTSYSTSKAGLRGFSEALRRELAGSDVGVTHVSPRAVRTPMNHGALAEFNRLTGVRSDAPERVATQIYQALINERKELTIGWPEKLFVKLNALAPVFIDDALISNRHIGETLIARQLAGEA